MINHQLLPSLTYSKDKATMWPNKLNFRTRKKLWFDPLSCEIIRRDPPFWGTSTRYDTGAQCFPFPFVTLASTQATPAASSSHPSSRFKGCKPLRSPGRLRPWQMLLLLLLPLLFVWLSSKCIICLLVPTKKLVQRFKGVWKSAYWAVQVMHWSQLPAALPLSNYGICKAWWGSDLYSSHSI